MGEQPGDEAEELLDVGAPRAPRWDAWVRRWQTRRGLQVLVGVLALVVAGAVVVAQNRSGPRGRDAAPVPSTSMSPRPSTIPVPEPSTTYVDNEYLIAVPAQDMRAQVRRCGSCVASTLTDAALSRAVAQFPGAQALAGGTVTQHGMLVLRTVEADLGAAGLAHLTVRRDGAAPAAATVRTEPGDGYRTITVTAVHAGCRFTAVVVTRAVDAPIAAARAWVARTPLRCG